MDIKKEKQKIEKALRVIELIETCDWQLEQHKIYTLVSFNSMREYYKKRITIMEAVKARLENYYKNLIK